MFVNASARDTREDGEQVGRAELSGFAAAVVAGQSTDDPT